jgi:hypothetical protein
MLDAVAKSFSFRVSTPSRQGPPPHAAARPRAGLVGAPHHSGPRGRSRRKPVCKREHCGFVGFERDLLGEHHVASCYGPFSNETPPCLGFQFFIKLPNIAHGALMNSISSPGVRSCDFEITLGVKLRTLIRRQPFAEKTTRTRFRPILFDEAPIERTQRAQLRTAGMASSEQKHLSRRESVYPPTRRG